ncbi:MAG TPA: hypothetical protein VEV41_24510 [Terriglobales bacterium]|nr:hypothetical protein [Terriglobales bacterium]
MSLKAELPCGIMCRMYAEVVKRGGIPSKPGLIHESGRAMTCAECDASYYLHYDREAEERFTLCSILAAEIITARHPDHEQTIVLELPELITEESSKKEIVWSARLNLANLHKKKPDII